jgi:hypothetical protein
MVVPPVVASVAPIVAVEVLTVSTVGTLTSGGACVVKVVSAEYPVPALFVAYART